MGERSTTRGPEPTDDVDSGLQPQRTVLAWQRTVLAACASVVLCARSAHHGGWAALALACALVTLVVIVVAIARGRARGRRGPAAAARCTPTRSIGALSAALSATAFAVLAWVIFGTN